MRLKAIPPTLFRRSNLPIALVVSLSLLIGVVYSFVLFPMLPENLREVDPDGLNAIAINLYEGKGLVEESGAPVTHKDPLYSVFIAAIYTPFGPHLWMLQLSAILLHAATIVVLYAIASRLYPGRKLVALATAAAFGFYPHLVWYLPRAQMTTLLTFLVACFMLSLISLLESPGWKKGAISGLFLGLSTLTRGVTLLFPLALIPVLLLEARKRRRLAVVSWLFLAFTMLLVMTPYFIRNYSITNRFDPVALRGGVQFLWGSFSLDYDPSFIPVKHQGEVDPVVAARITELRTQVEEDEGEMTDVEWDVYAQREAIRSVLEEPLAFLHKVVWQIPRFWVLAYNNTKTTLLKISSSVILPLAVIGVAYSLRNRAKILIVLTFALYYMGVHIAVIAVAGHSLPIMPYVLMFAVYGLANLAERTTRLRARLAGPRPVVRGLR